MPVDYSFPHPDVEETFDERLCRFSNYEKNFAVAQYSDDSAPHRGKGWFRLMEQDAGVVEWDDDRWSLEKGYGNNHWWFYTNDLRYSHKICPTGSWVKSHYMWWPHEVHGHTV